MKNKRIIINLTVSEVIDIIGWVIIIVILILIHLPKIIIILN